MKKGRRSTLLGFWILAALFVGGIGGLVGSPTAMRVANGVFAVGFVRLLWRSLGQDRPISAALYGLLAAAFALLAYMVMWTAPIYEVVGAVIDEL